MLASRGPGARSPAAGSSACRRYDAGPFATCAGTPGLRHPRVHPVDAGVFRRAGSGRRRTICSTSTSWRWNRIARRCGGALRSNPLNIFWLGVAVAGILNGTFAVPMKRARAWKFEHIWGVFSLLAMVVIPWLAVVWAVPGWRNILATVPGPALGSLILLGLLLGVASLLYGLAIDLLGIALGFAIQLGLSIVAGSLVPFALIRGFSARTL